MQAFNQRSGAEEISFSEKNPQLQCRRRFKFPLPSQSEPQLLCGQRSPKSRAPRRGLPFPAELRYHLGEWPEAVG